MKIVAQLKNVCEKIFKNESHKNNILNLRNMEFLEQHLTDLRDIDDLETIGEENLNKKLKETLTVLSIISLYNTRTQCVKPIIHQKEAERCAKEGYLTIKPLKWFIEILTTESEWRVKNNVIDVAVVMNALRWCLRNYVLVPPKSLLNKNTNATKK